MRIIEVLQKGKVYSQVRFEDEHIEAVPNQYAVTGMDYISVKMLKGSSGYTRYEGEHITARLEKNRITLRNKDNICSATIAYNQRSWGAAKGWCLFLMEASKGFSFAEAVDSFERHGIRMIVSG